jgi:hypothetical protein
MPKPDPLILLVAVDGSPASLAAVQQALDLAERGLPLQLVLLNVQPPPTLYEVVVAHDRERLDDIRAGAGADLLAPALALARSKLEGFAHNPERHARYGTKVLLKFKLLEWGQISKAEFSAWAMNVSYMRELHQRFGQGHSLNTWLDMILAELARSGAMQELDGVLHDA